MAIDFPDSNLSLNQIFTDPTSGKSWVWDGEKWMSYANPTPNLFLVPTGVIITWPVSNAPAGWIMCDGQSYLRSTYPALYDVILTAYGLGSSTDSTTFNVPDLRNRFPAGIGTSAWSNTLNQKSGNPNAVIVNHQHTISHGHSGFNASISGGQHSHSITHTHNLSAVSDLGHSHDARYLVDLPNDGQQTGGQAAGTREYLRPWDYNDPARFRLTSGSDGSHNHTFTVDPHTGSSDSTIINAGHTHGLTVNGSTANSNTVGVSAANANLPPYIVLNYIIKT